MNHVQPPFHWVDDQARAWRLAAAIREDDGALFDAIVEEARTEGPQAVDRVLAALSRNLVVRLGMSLGMDGLDDLIEAELKGCDELRGQQDQEGPV